MMLAAAIASLAIVVQDHCPLRAAARTTATEQALLWEGDVLEVRGRRGDYLEVYDHRLERGGYVRGSEVRGLTLDPAEAPQLLAVVRFLRDMPGREALGISYAAAYLRAVPANALTAEPLDAIGTMAERLAEQLSTERSSAATGSPAAHLDVVAQFGIHMTAFGTGEHIQTCYDGEVFRRVLTMRSANAAELAHAALGLTRDDCIDPALGPTARYQWDHWRAQVLDDVSEVKLEGPLKSRLHARRANVWSALAYESARRGEDSATESRRALDELTAVDAGELGEDNRAIFSEAALRVSAVRWATNTNPQTVGPLSIRTEPGEPGQTCVSLEDKRQRESAPLIKRCTFGIVWTASASGNMGGTALALAVQPQDGWLELWLFHRGALGWKVDVIPPSAEGPDLGFIEFAGWTPGAKRVLLVREARVRGHFRRRFEELRVEDLLSEREASAPELIPDFQRWQDASWRRDTLALR